MKFSVITVCLNSEKTIEKTIESVLNQQGIELEYIIIDGCSTDQTVEIIKRYESRISYWCSEPDGGIYEAMNKGIAAATGDVISFINSNDWYADDALRSVQGKMLEGDFDLVCGKVARVRDGVAEGTSTRPKEETDLYYKMFCPHPGIFARRTVFSRFGAFDPQYRICADYDWLLRVYNKGVHIVYIDAITSYFSLGGISSGYRLLTERKAVSLKHLPSDLYDKYYNKIVEEHDRGVLWHKYHYVLTLTQSDPHLIEEIREVLSIGNECSLFGTGLIAHECQELFRILNIRLKHIYDNDRNKQGKEFLGKIIESSDRIKPDETIVIGTTLYADDIKGQLNARQITKCIGIRDIMEMIVSHAETTSGNVIDLEVNGYV